LPLFNTEQNYPPIDLPIIRSSHWSSFRYFAQEHTSLARDFGNAE